jgi:hypothetical protein
LKDLKVFGTANKGRWWSQNQERLLRRASDIRAPFQELAFALYTTYSIAFLVDIDMFCEDDVIRTEGHRRIGLLRLRRCQTLWSRLQVHVEHSREVESVEAFCIDFKVKALCVCLRARK